MNTTGEATNSPLALDSDHPANLLRGMLYIQAELSERKRKPEINTFGVIAADCGGWADQVRDLFLEIAKDANYAVERLQAGEIAEAQQALQAIKIQALQGQIPKAEPAKPAPGK